MKAALFAVVVALVACGPAVPTPADQAGVGTYGAALQGCIAQAKATDAGLPGYETCAHKVDVVFGRVDGGT